MSKKIKLTKGAFAIVDDEDFESLSRFKWYFTSGYAARWCGGKRLYMHRLLNKTPNGVDTDHINQDKLDNRRSNLRAATRSLNAFNRPSTLNKSGVVGVRWNAEKKRWKAYITVNYRQLNLGSYRDKESAIIARIKAESLYYGL